MCTCTHTLVEQSTRGEWRWLPRTGWKRPVTSQKNSCPHHRNSHAERGCWSEQPPNGEQLKQDDCGKGSHGIIMVVVGQFSTVDHSSCHSSTEGGWGPRHSSVHLPNFFSLTCCFPQDSQRKKLTQLCLPAYTGRPRNQWGTHTVILLDGSTIQTHLGNKCGTKEEEVWLQQLEKRDASCITTKHPVIKGCRAEEEHATSLRF